MNKTEERYMKIIDILKRNPIVTVAEFANYLAVSPETIRKDLTALAGQGQITRIHGGAALAGDPMTGVSFHFREGVRKKEKRMLAKEACSLIEPGDSLIIESGTTMVEMVKLLVELPELLKTLVIITNSFHIITLLEMGQICARSFFLGGWINESEERTQGKLTIGEMRNFHVDKCFLSGAALGKDLILSAFYENDMLFQRQAMKCASHSILLMEAGKYPTQAVLSVASVGEFHHLITNIAFDKVQYEMLAKSKAQVKYLMTDQS